MDEHDEKVEEFISLAAIKCKTESRLYSRKIKMPLKVNPTPVYLETAPAPWDNKNIAPFVSPYAAFDFHKYSLLVVASTTNQSNWKTYADLFIKMKIKSSILIIPESVV